jgi:hypothetical protein
MPGHTQPSSAAGVLLALDPGPERTAWLELTNGRPTAFAIEPNDLVLDRVRDTAARVLAVEMIASYGKPVGAEVFDTCVWIGRFIQRWDDRPARGLLRPVFRRDVKLHLCDSSRAKDPHVRQALIDRYGPGKDAAIGRKATPGPLFGVSSHVWSALAVAVTVADELAVARREVA